MVVRFLEDQPQKNSVRFLSEEQVNQSRIDTAFDPSNDKTVERAPFLPVASIRTPDGERLEGTSAEFDSNSGLLGAILGAAKLPGDVLAGRRQVRDKDGNLRQDIINDSFELAALGSPVSNAARNTKTAARLRNAEPETVSRVTEAERLGIELSKGQGTRNPALQAREEDILAGTSGEAAQKALRMQREVQQDQVRSALARIQDELAPGDARTVNQGGEALRDAVTAQTQKFKDDSREAFQNVDNSTAEVSREAIPNLVQSIDNRLIEEFGADNIGQFKAVNNSLRELQQLVDNPAAAVNAGIPWKRIQGIRSRIINNINAGTPEGAALTTMRRQLDDSLDDIVINGLVSGDKQALSDLKKARALWARYQGILTNAQSAVRKIAEGSLDGGQVANLIVGASQVGSKNAGAAIVKEIKSIIGKDHQSINELKRGVITRLFSDTATGDVKTFGKLASDINRFTADDAPELARELFGKEGIRELRRLAGVIRSLTPEDVATNPSRSGQTVLRNLNRLANSNFAQLSLAAIDLQTLILGFAARAGLNKVARREAVRLAQPPVSQVVQGSRTLDAVGNPLTIPGTSLALPTVETPIIIDPRRF